jgi:RNA polymerase sigma factor (sigma-70 family)
VTDSGKNLFIAELARSHGDRLRRFLRVRTRNTSDVPDMVQEVFLRMLRVPNWEVIRSPEAYLYTVALHVAQQHAMKEGQAPSSTNVSDLMGELQAAADADPVLLVCADQSLEGFIRALGKLSPKVLATFILHRNYGMTLEEISEELHISFAMAKKYLVRALFECKEHLSHEQ